MFVSLLPDLLNTTIRISVDCYLSVFASAPTNISGEWLPDDVFNAGIRVKWLPPLHINGALRGYNVVYFKTGVLGNNNSVLTGPSITTVEINDLKFYTNYTILVRAQTLQGDGAWSSPMVFQTREGSKLRFRTFHDSVK